MKVRCAAIDPAIRPDTLDMLRKRHGEELDQLWRNQFGYGLDCLTEVEAQNLCRQHSVVAIEDFLVQAAVEARGRGLQPAVDDRAKNLGQGCQSAAATDRPKTARRFLGIASSCAPRRAADREASDGNSPNVAVIAISVCPRGIHGFVAWRETLNKEAKIPAN